MRKINDGLNRFQRYRQRHPDRVRANSAKFRQRHPERIIETRRRRTESGKIAAYKIKRRWEIIGVAFEQQNGRCAICNRKLKYPCQDHNHKCCKKTDTRSGYASGCPKCRRGLLCAGCNAGLHLIEDSKRHQAAIDYLKKWSIP